MTDKSWTDTEKTVKAAWEAVLNTENIAPESDFFELGGDSLLMIDMLFALNEALQVELDPGMVFENATLRGFAELIDAQTAKAPAGAQRAS